MASSSDASCRIWDCRDDPPSATQITPLNRAVPRTRAEFVADELRRRILSGELEAGTWLRQNEIAEQLQVSSTPVREAFTALAREGLVRQDAHRGVVVFQPTLQEIRETYEVRIALEPLATEFAAKLATEADLAAIERLRQAMSHSKDSLEYVELNREFHRVIYQSSGRELLLQMIERLRDASEMYIRRIAIKHSARYRAAVEREHAEIVTALRARAPKRARKAMEQHLEHNFEEISRSLESM
jgi:DNA-binding GntR family transcriptional regulator